MHTAAAQLLSDTFKAQLDAYPTTLADDLVLLAMEQKKRSRKDKLRFEAPGERVLVAV